MTNHSLLVSTMRDRVARGATALDRLRPGWHHEVRPDQINGASMTMCVLGQLWGSWDIAIQVAQRLDPVEAAQDPVNVVRHYGFSAGDVESPDVVGSYKSEWQRQITKRRRNDAAARGR
jgi:hypothetical protein